MKSRLSVMKMQLQIMRQKFLSVCVTLVENVVISIHTRHNYRISLGRVRYCVDLFAYFTWKCPKHRTAASITTHSAALSYAMHADGVKAKSRARKRRGKRQVPLWKVCLADYNRREIFSAKQTAKLSRAYLRNKFVWQKLHVSCMCNTLVKRVFCSWKEE